MLELEALSLSHRLSDEEIIERAIRNVIKKPGPWLIEEIEISKRREFKEGVWEVYVHMDNGAGTEVMLNRIGDAGPEETSLCDGSLASIREGWYPNLVGISYVFEFTNIDPATGNVTGGVSSGLFYCMAPSGWLIGPNEYISPNTNSVKMRYRRRFDLE